MVIDLYKIEPSQNLRRYYSVSVSMDLFGSPVLIRSWGRIGTYGRSKAEIYNQPAEATAAAEVLAKKKGLRGYRSR